MSKKVKIKNNSKSNQKFQLGRTSKKKSNANKNAGEKIRSPLWFNIVLIVIPILFFIVLELSLRIFNYGIDTTQWVEISPGKLILNPDVAYRYFHSTKGVPYSNQNSFDAVKKSNAFRIFILGGSSAAGYPYTPNGDFGKYIQKKLEILYPDRYIEVVNVALTATNSYTMLDLIPGVLEKEPDLVLIYSGHNEYYGALGVGSMESMGKSSTVVKLILSLEKYKTITLLRNIITWVGGIFSSDEENKPHQSGTLMSRMAKDKLIALNSDVFNDGINQFEENLKDIIIECQEKNIPIVVGTLTSNLRDQKPFSPIRSEQLPLADSIYLEAKNALTVDNQNLALEKFIYAKDLDGLRFRAPQKINKIIISLSDQYKIPCVNIFDEFNKMSPQGIVGNNLMTDHLHPTSEGYDKIGELFIEKLENIGYLPDIGKTELSTWQIDSLVNISLHQSVLDSVIAEYRILILKNDWPFSESKSVEYMIRLFNLKNFIDSTALKVIDNKTSWEQAHRSVALYYLESKDYNNFIREMNTLIIQYPFIAEYYSFASEQLLNAKLFEEAIPFLKKGFEASPNAFYSKWIGIILLSQNKTDDAVRYLEKSMEFSKSDPQVLFNLAGAYSKKEMFAEALQKINDCLRINPSYPMAENLRDQLRTIVEMKNL